MAQAGLRYHFAIRSRSERSTKNIQNFVASRCREAPTPTCKAKINEEYYLRCMYLFRFAAS